MSTFLLEIVTPEHKVFEDQVNMITVKGVEGELGILAGHIPMVTPLQVGPMKIKTGSKEHWLAVHGGFVEVRRDKVVVLAESAELPEEIDIERAKAAKARAEQRLAMAQRSKQDHVDFRRAELSLQRAVTRIQVSQRNVSR
ncbi:F0F1 ATP synthase subunit epsilon [Paenibacillus dendritiformis]|uniref:ATP synthase epsilon chain n=1 Tax=Paenibacillus dendritiformis C454 TaxID=1131935 RepID=H3SQ25_9BACL|nr:F0F1 ATP synthase subunit epsilon [Paenibacillus dendritiformis]EHQ58817.1 AtpC [Paenibacillus dendritiformis C454]PZM62221.1 F0F1 ATP synthase subunit epsilon [Paenibacillus dendritiformis]TDL51746.1 F0F1 ATP synthase subunit epsilon [Paenibacillus dendritiformis]WGU93697.1 F0F1 ATP synthase subunit epsilon [Paenibacillus dendritiformis]CAH8767455.1 F0F1 ATP synthase subunit epsilon [Paenibacillus dendritiformis]